MAPARTHNAADDDDPITAEYDVYLTPEQQEQILLLQYPNRTRNRPYNNLHGSMPQDVRIKPNTGFMEVDVGLNTNHNFNKYKGLQWGDALETSREVHNSSSTYGPAAGFHGAKARITSRAQFRDQVDRENKIFNDLSGFEHAEAEGRVMKTQTLGGQIIRHDRAYTAAEEGGTEEERGKPIYFVGAFRGEELHLTKVTGTVQLRPQFHHLDAEEQRARLSASRSAAAEAASSGAEAKPQDPRGLLTREKKVEEGKPKLEDINREILRQAEGERWTRLEYVDENMDEAYDKFHERMFVKEPDTAPRLESGMDAWDYLDAIAAPRQGSPGRRRKRRPRRRSDRSEGEGELEDGDEAGEAVEGAGQEAVAG